MGWLRATDPAGLVAYLNSGAPHFRANLLTLTLASGTVVRITDYDVDVVSGTLGTFLSTGPRFSRSLVTHRKGVQVDSMTLSVVPRPTDLLGTTPWLTSIRAGALDYAIVQLDIGIFDQATPTVLQGTFNWFYGRIADIPDISAMGAEIECKTDLARLDVLMPRNIIQPGCLNTLFDAACGLAETSFRTTGTISGVNGDGSLQTTIAQASGYFDGGRIYLTSGDNNNVVRKIKQQVGGAVYLFSPFVFTVTAGTTFRANPGCPKTKDICQSKFSNGARFRGMPFVPTPETVL